MRFMILIKANKDTEADVMPSEQLLAEMGQYNEELVKADRNTEAGVLPTEQDLATMGKYNDELLKAGVLLDGAGLQPSSKGARVTFQGGKLQVTDGPFAETKELIAGYWLINVKSKQEAIEWAKRVPFDKIPHEGRVAEIEIRQMFELEDFLEVPASVSDVAPAFRLAVKMWSDRSLCQPIPYTKRSTPSTSPTPVACSPR